MSASTIEEPLLTNNPLRYVLFPIHYNDVWQSYKNAEARFWNAEEIDLADDADAFQGASGKEKAFLIQCLAVLASLETRFSESLPKRFGQEIQIPEGRCYYGFQIMQQNEMWTLLLQVFRNYATREDVDQISDLFDHVPAISKRIQWTQANIIDSKEHFSHRIAAYAVYLYVFSTIELMLLYFTGSKFTGLAKATLRIFVDKLRNADFCNVIRKQLKTRPSQEYVHKLVTEAVEIEKAFIDELLGLSGGSLALNATPVKIADAKSQVEFLANQNLIDAERKKESVDEEKRVKADKKTSTIKSDLTFATDVDF